MRLDDKLEMKNCNTTLTEKQQRYQHYHQVKLITSNVLQVKILPSDLSRIIEQARFTYPPFDRAFENE